MLASEIIRRVREIQVRTGRHVADVLAGEYVSVFKGGGIEFEEVRPYVPGDDVRTIDWNVTARMGEPFVKRYVEERQLTLMLVCDISASQDFGSGARSKREAAAELCALLAFSAIRNDDNVGLALFHGDIEQYIPPRKGQKHALRVVREVLAHGELDGETSTGSPRRLLTPGARRTTAPNAKTGSAKAAGPNATDTHSDTRSDTDSDTHSGTHSAPRVASMVDAARSRDEAPSIASKISAWLSRLTPMAASHLRSPRQATDISRAIEFVMGVTRRRSVCFVVSDFLDDNFERALLTANRRHDVIAVLITDPNELELPSVGMVTLADPETGESRLYDTGSKAFRDAVAATAGERVRALEKRLRSSGIDFIHIDAAGSVVEPLVRFFHMRERRRAR
ncbi:MAG: hypothetical protein ACI8TX_003374 [Hyphomicrobiaceae bacterium]|jgi:uncharacterized protein (DUF58 family)